MSLPLSIKNDFFRLGGMIFLFFFLSAGLCYGEAQTKATKAQPETKSTQPESQSKIKGPVVITSDMLTADNKAHTALFEKSVIAKTTDMTIYADRMLVYYQEGTGDVTRIDSEGNVKVIKGDRVITSHEATYLADGDKAIFTGDPRAVQGENVVTGKKMTYLMSDDRFLVEDSKVFLTKKKEQ
jgi:lipopolysaccharide export system protein LptA